MTTKVEMVSERLEWPTWTWNVSTLIYVRIRCVLHTQTVRNWNGPAHSSERFFCAQCFGFSSATLIKINSQRKMKKSYSCSFEKIWTLFYYILSIVYDITETKLKIIFKNFYKAIGKKLSKNDQQGEWKRGKEGKI